MSFLAPLYVAGLLAITLPILFHLIRRTPQGRQPFSSLMFLAPSPPRVTRRSRLNNIFLLILRALALSLLAFAFARPFFRQKEGTSLSQTQGRRIAILVDTSSSMQRGDLWQQATQQVEKTLASLSPTDVVGLYFFDRQVTNAFSFSQWMQSGSSQSLALLKMRLAAERPSLRGTNLGDALSTVADAVAEEDSGANRPPSASLAREVILISDLERGGHAETLQGHQWPADVVLDVRPVALHDATSNASMQIVKDSAADANESADTGQPKLRVRVSNEPNSTREQLSLHWANERGAIANIEPVNIYVPAGRSRVVHIAWPGPEQSADRLLLTGDDCDFDNTLYVVPLQQDKVRVVYLGDDLADDTKGTRFYLQRVIMPTPQRSVEFVARTAAEPLIASDLNGARLVVLPAGAPADRLPVLRSFIEQGGEILWLLSNSNAANGLANVMGQNALPVEEAATNNFSLLGKIAFDHPLFAPFSDPRFSDFTKIHFWQHRKMTLPENASVHGIAWFDNGDPFLFEQLIGKGRLLVMTSGWAPADSQLALSTKFVPLIDGLLGHRESADIGAQYSVGDPIPLPPASANPRLLIGPDGGRAELMPDATSFEGTDRPGIYRFQREGQTTPVAVNLSPDESRTAPIAVEELEQWGVKLGTKPVSDEMVARQRQLQIAELENKQKLWQWLIVTVLGILLLETVVAGRLARRTAPAEVSGGVS